MNRGLLLVAMLGALVAGCGGIGLDELDQFAINWSVQVYNNTRETAAVTVEVADTKQSFELAGGENETVRSFKPGPWSVTISDPKDRRAYLVQKLANLNGALNAAQSDSWRFVPITSTSQLQSDIAEVRAALAGMDAGGITVGSCNGQIKDPTGDDLAVFTVRANGRWGCGTS